MSDHIHILLGLKPAMALADLVRDIKADSSDFINTKKFVEDLAGRKAMALFRMDILNSTPSFATFRTRSNIIGADHLRTSIWRG
jgi:REP element-mobilizing transposase RayT